MRYKKYLFLYFLFSFNVFYAQNREKDSISYTQKLNKIDQLKNKEEQIIQKNKLLSDLRKKGYLFSSIDSISSSESKLFLSPTIQNLKVSYLDDLSKKNTVICKSFDELASLGDKLIEKYQNQGYVLASWSVDSCEQISNVVSCILKVERGKQYTIDSLEIISKEPLIDHEFLKKIINFKKGDFLTVAKINDIDKKISNIPYLSTGANKEYYIVDTSINCRLPLQSRKINQFNAIIGLLPNAYNSNEMQLTGDVSLHLYNLFSRGVETSFQWQKSQANTQFLTLKLNVPYLFQTNMGALFGFNLEKFDTAFVRLTLDLGLKYNIEYNKYFVLNYWYQSSTILSLDNSYILQKKLPSTQDYSSFQFGISYFHKNTDKFLFPRKGTTLDISFRIGEKSIEKNNNVLAAKDQNGNSLKYLYDSITLKNTIIYLQFNFEKYTYISRSISLKSAIYSKFMFSKNISISEKYNIGGNKLPRGFDDMSLSTPYYMTMVSECQFYLAPQFYTMLFVDIASIQNPNKTKFEQINPYGFGAGFVVKTKGSTFSFSLAYGKIYDNPIVFNNGKIHFGYVANF